MKKFFILLFILTQEVFAAEPSTRSGNIGTVAEGTKIRPYYFINVASDNDVPLDVNMRYWEGIRPSNGQFKIVDETCNRLEFAFYVDGNTAEFNKYIDPNQVEFNFRIFAARRYSSAVIVCAGSAKCGELELSGTPTEDHSSYLFNNGFLAPDQSHKWVSGISTSTVKWLSPVTLTDNNRNDNGIARITLDTNGYAIWWCEITAIKGKPAMVNCVASCW